MSEEHEQLGIPWPRQRWRRLLVWISGALLVMLLMIAAGGYLILQSDWFREYVRQRIVQVAESTTGARVEIANFDFNVGQLSATVQGLVLHGSEGPDEAPFVSIDSVTVGLRIVSVLERRIDLAQLLVERPAVNIIVNPDGSTNVPGPNRPPSGKLFTENLLDLKIGEYEIDNGLIVYDNRSVPVNIRGEDLLLVMDYDAQAPAYMGSLETGGVNITLPNGELIDTVLSTGFTLRSTSVDFDDFRLATEDSYISATGRVNDLRTVDVTMQLTGAIDLAELQQRLNLPIRPEGTASLDAAIQLTPMGGETAGLVAPENANTVTPVDISTENITISRLQIDSPMGNVALNGTLEGLRAPQGALQLTVQSALAQAVPALRLPLKPQGTANFNGQLEVNGTNGFNGTVRGTLTTQGLGYTRDRLDVQNASIRGALTVQRRELRLQNFTGRALGSDLTGDLTLTNWNRLDVTGDLTGLVLSRASDIFIERPLPWGGTASGSYHLNTSLNAEDLVAETSLRILPNGQGERIDGTVSAVYNNADRTISLPAAAVATADSRVEANGVLGRELRVRARTTNLNDVLPALALFQDNPPEQFPITLANGSATADGTLTGPLNDPTFRGQATLINGRMNVRDQEIRVDRFSAEVTASRAQVVARNLNLNRDLAEVSGSASLTARPGSAYAGFGNAELSATLAVANLSLAETAAEAGFGDRGISGTAAATVRLAGSVERPQARVALDVADPSALGEMMDRLQASVEYMPGELRVADGRVTDGPSLLRFSGDYKHAQGDWRSGEVTFDAVTDSLDASLLEHVRNLTVPVSTTLNGRLHATGDISNGTFVLNSTNSDVSARRIVIDQVPIGDLTAISETRGNDLTLNFGGTVLESIVEGSGNWTLEGEAPGTAQVTFTRLNFDSVYRLAMLGRRDGPPPGPPPFDGFVQGGAQLTVPLQALNQVTGQVELSQVEVRPKPDQALRLGVKPEDVILTNSMPVLFDFSSKALSVRQASFTGADTELMATGTVPFDGSGADLRMEGSLNLVVLQLLNPNLLAEGTATMETTVRGNLQDPDLNGQLHLAGASLFLSDLPNGIDNASGTILFNLNRATIQTLTAETGGGTIDITGFLEFDSDLIYRLQAQATGVRVRYPQDLSTTFDAQLTLTGTSAASTVGGDITVLRAAFTPSTDTGQLLAQFSQPTPTPANPNEYLQGMQFDVEVRSSPNFQLETSLTRNVEAEVNLNLRGTALRPAVLGSISVNRGEIEVLGTRYTVDRGEVRFLNPVRIEPNFDVDLSTQARGVTVNISISGPMSRLAVNYSSDPPLQSNEIIALLAVGRDPTQTTAQNNPGVGQSTAPGFMAAGGSLLGQAISEQVSSRLQRFFGASRVKIDPTLTGVDNLPQARLTLEQQVSRDITLTYITNLNRTTEQLVRIQWDFNREWSAIAVRDPSGQFSLDFQFRKRF